MLYIQLPLRNSVHVSLLKAVRNPLIKKQSFQNYLTQEAFSFQKYLFNILHNQTSADYSWRRTCLYQTSRHFGLCGPPILPLLCKNRHNVNPWLIHVNVWQKPLQYHKVISLQLIKINGKKIKWTHTRCK